MLIFRFCYPLSGTSNQLKQVGYHWLVNALGLLFCHKISIYLDRLLSFGLESLKRKGGDLYLYIIAMVD